MVVLFAGIWSEVLRKYREGGSGGGRDAGWGAVDGVARSVPPGRRELYRPPLLLITCTKLNR